MRSVQKLICLFSLIFVSCFSQDGVPTPQYGDNFHIGIDMMDFDLYETPHSKSSGAISLLSSLLYSTLFDFTGSTKLKNDLVASYALSPDQKIWDITLRDSVFFHDGTKLDANDVKATFDAVKKNPGNPFHDFMTSLQKIEVLNPHRLKFYLDKYDAFFAYGLQIVCILKKDQWQKPNVKFPLTGTGAYKIASYDKKKNILNLVPHTPKKMSGPYLGGVTVHFLPNYLDGLVLVTQEKLDLLYVADPTYEKLFAQNKKYRMIRQKKPLHYLIDFNTDLGRTFHDQIARQEVAALINNESSASQSVSTKIPTHLNILSYHEHEFNRVLLYQILQPFYARGIKLNPQLDPLATFLKKMARRDYDLALYPANFFFQDYYVYQYALTAQQQKSFDEKDENLLEQMRHDPLPKNRHLASDRINNILKTSVPFMIIKTRHVPLIIHERFTGYSQNPIEMMDEIEKMWVPKEKQKYRLSL